MAQTDQKARAKHGTQGLNPRVFALRKAPSGFRLKHGAQGAVYRRKQHDFSPFERDPFYAPVGWYSPRMKRRSARAALALPLQAEAKCFAYKGRMVRFRWFLICFIGFSLVLGGCLPGADKEVPETQNKSYLRGKRYLREDRKKEALDAFLQVIAESPANAPESHLEAGRLYQNTAKDPIAAIYHYRKFLDQRPQGQEAPIVRQMIESARKDFAAQLPGTPFDSDADRLDLLKMLQDAREQNDTLRRELEQAQGRLAQAGVSARPATIVTTAQAPAPQQTRDTVLYPQGVTANATTGQSRTGTAAPAQQPAPAQTADGRRSYIVKSGDTLSRISQQMYGTPSRWGDIFEANRNLLPTPHSLRVGQTLVIP